MAAMVQLADQLMVGHVDLQIVVGPSGRPVLNHLYFPSYLCAQCDDEAKLFNSSDATASSCCKDSTLIFNLFNMELHKFNISMYNSKHGFA